MKLNMNQERTILSPAQDMLVKTITPAFYQELDDFDGFRGHTLISEFAFSEKWSTWEIHPKGDELVYLVSGETDFVLHNPDGEDQVVRVSAPGDYVIVPKDTWHTAVPVTDTRCLFVTPGEGTQNALAPGGEPL